jgi:hypothetical protein
LNKLEKKGGHPKNGLGKNLQEMTLGILGVKVTENPLPL